MSTPVGTAKRAAGMPKVRVTYMEELQIEWVWKPLAAMMNENVTDLVYWIPPLYNSNIEGFSTKSAATKPKGSVRKRKLSKSTRKAKVTSFDKVKEEMEDMDGSSTWRPKVMSHDSIIEEIEEEDGSIVKIRRKKKLASSRRRSRTFPLDDRIVAELLREDNEWENLSDNESGIYEESFQMAKESGSGVSSQTMDEEEDGSSAKVRKKKFSSSRRKAKLTFDESITENTEEESISLVKVKKRKLASSRRRSSTLCPVEIEKNLVNVGESLPDDDKLENQDNDKSRIHENMNVNRSQAVESGIDSEKEMSDNEKEIFRKKPTIHNTPDIVQRNTNKPNKPQSSPTILKLMEKLSHMSLNGIIQPKNKKKSNKKNKRPSVRIYQKNANNSFIQHSSNYFESFNSKTSNQTKIIIKAKPLLSEKSSMESVNSILSRNEETESGIYEDSDRENEDTNSNIENLRNAQLQMMLRILAQVYEEKLSQQKTELDHLTTRVQSQEKLIEQLVHFTVGLKSDLDKLRKNEKLSNQCKTTIEKLKDIEQKDKSQNCESNDNVIVDISQRKPKSNVVVIKVGEF